MKLIARLVDLQGGHRDVVVNSADAEDIGIRPLDRIVLTGPDGVRTTGIIHTSPTLVAAGEIGVSADVADLLILKGGEVLKADPAPRPHSVDLIRKKMDGGELSDEEIHLLISDIAAGNLSDIELTAYATAVYVHDLTENEIVSMINAMVATGESIEFEAGPVMDVHSIGGVPGNKYAPITVSICAANGLVIPKTSSRAISSACGTADFMEVVCPVEHSARDIKRIAEATGGTLVWGGGVNLAPADDAIIRVEYPLSMDPRGQLIASVLAKKKAVGAQYVVIDIPVGEGAKVEAYDVARRLARDFISVGERVGLTVRAAITYGGQPIGRAIGPALEIREAISAMESTEGPGSLVEKACELAGILLELGGKAAKGEGYELAKETLRSGRALAKFREIIAAQGGSPTLRSADVEVGTWTHDVKALTNGYVERIDNKAVNRIARAAGAPRDKGAGLYFHFKKGRKVEVGETLFTIHAENEHKLREAVALAEQLKPVRVEGMVIEEIVE